MSDKAIKDKKLFDEIVAEYALKDYTISTRLVRENEVISSLKLLGDTSSIKTIIEIGCGVAAPYNYLSKYINFDKYVGLDHSFGMIEKAKELHKNSKNISFECVDIKDYNGFKEADLVIALGVLHHVDDVNKFLEILYQKTNDNVKILIFEPISNNLIINFLRNFRTKVDSAYSSEQVFFKPDDLVKLFIKNNFKSINYEYKGYFSTPFGEVILKPIWFFALISKITIFIDSVMEKHLPDFLKKYSWGISLVATKKETL